MNKPYSCIDLEACQVLNIFPTWICGKILVNFFLFVRLNISITQDFLRILWNRAQLVFGHLYYRIPDLYYTHILPGLRSFKIPENAFATSCPVFSFKGIIQTNFEITSITVSKYFIPLLCLKSFAYQLNQQPRFIQCH